MLKAPEAINPMSRSNPVTEVKSDLIYIASGMLVEKLRDGIERCEDEIERIRGKIRDAEEGHKRNENPYDPYASLPLFSLQTQATANIMQLREDIYWLIFRFSLNTRYPL